MKSKFNSNILLFVLVWVFLAAGSLHSGMLEGLQYAFEEGTSFSGIRSEINAASSYYQRFRTPLASLYAGFQSLTGSDIIEKDDGTVIVRMPSGQLDTQEPPIAESEIIASVEEVKHLKQAVEESGAQFLYVLAPLKGDFAVYPAGLENYGPQNYALTLEKLLEAEIPVLDLKEKMSQEGLLNEDSYFMTDHHWRPQIGFWASGTICEELNRRYGFAYDKSVTDISNYTVETLPRYFFGSTARKVGRLFANQLDDFEVITPKFDTELTASRPFAEEFRKGSFEDSLCYAENLKNEQTCYGYYSGGDSRLQIFTNLRRPEGKTFLIVRDSYACTVVPFLTLTAREVIQTDVRNYTIYDGPKQNVYELIREYQPDYVLILYSGGAENKTDRFHFGE